MTKFELNRLLEYSGQAIIEEIKRVADLLKVTPLTGKAFEAVSRVNRVTVRKRFGSWKAALEAADLGHLYTGTVVTTQMKVQPNRGKSDRDLLDNLRDLSASLGRTDISQRDVAKHGQISKNLYIRRFGSWKRAVELAGLRQREQGAAQRVHTDEQLFSNLRNVWERFGRQPHYSEMDKPPSVVKSRNYVYRFGTWRKALLAFIEFVEKDTFVEENAPSTETLPQSETIEAGNFSQRNILGINKERREISLGLRFRVLHKDNFKCVLCGSNPPASPGLVLHVDHIVPWSKGGTTELESLRTLCAACNLGRGNSYAD